MMLIKAVFAFTALAAAQSCSTPDGDGTCQSTSSCSTFSVAGYCSGSADNQCCVSQSCSTSAGSGICTDTSNGCSGTFYSGACPGPSSVQCCVTSGGGSGGGSGSGLSAFDISATQSSSFWSCAAENYQKAVIRGYQQACSEGGAVDNSLLGSYNSATDAGFNNIDVYFFPCTGDQPNGYTCKDPQTQVSELESYLSDNSLSVGHIWLDIEPTSGACNAWNLGSSANLNLAQQYTSIISQSSYTWGIYANGNQWSGMFGSRDANVDSNLPLWAVQDDGTPGVDTTTTFMGGWTSAYAKQYSINDNTCGGSVDLDSFSG